VDSNSYSNVEINLVIDVALLQIGQQEGGPAPSRSYVVVRGTAGHSGGFLVAVDVAGRETLERVVVMVQSKADLLEVIGALGAIGGFAHFLYGGQQQGNEDAND